MKIKEFANKNSLALFYTTLSLLLVVIILFFSLAYEGGKCRIRMNKEDFRNKENRMMNRDFSPQRTPVNQEVNLPAGEDQATVTVKVLP